MLIQATPLPGVMVVEPVPVADERGAFARLWCRDSFAKAGIAFAPVQESLSGNRLRHTLRGLHFQRAPAEEQKLVRCSRGEIFDVAVDLRAESATRGQWFGITLSAANGRSLFLPHGVAHGFLTLADDSEVHYLIDTAYAPGLAAGVRWDTPVFGIAWPHPPAVISDRDAVWGDNA